VSPERSVSDFFTQRLGQSAEPRFALDRGTVLFDVADLGKWFLTIDRGRLNLTEGMHDADCVVHLTKTDLAAIINDQMNFLTAFQRGRIKISGSRRVASLVPLFFRSGL
jgi:hypothetical protein